MQTKRQERGIRRIAQVLDAAAGEFVDVGYEGATTNAIAARAGMSPGSLYQFFDNKAAIAEALAERLAVELEAAHALAFDTDVADLSADTWIDRVVDPLVSFYVSNPAFKALMHGADASPRLAECTQGLNDKVFDRLGAVIAVWAPGLRPRERSRAAQVCVQIFKGLMPMVLDAPARERRAVVAELKAALRGYLSTLTR